MKPVLTWLSDQVGNVGASMSEQAIASLLHQSGGEPVSIADTDRATEISEGLVNETPTEEGHLPLQLPRRVDTEAGGRLLSSASFTTQQIRPEPE